MKGFEDAAGLVLSLEGGFSDDPADRGGATKYGITQSSLDSCRAALPSLPVYVKDLSASQAASIYRLSYWNPARCDDLPWPVSLYTFDAMVNHGYRNAARMLQRALWVDDDGIIGSGTVAVAKTADVIQTGFAILTLRRQFYANLAATDGSQQAFLKGWLARVDRLRQELQTS